MQGKTLQSKVQPLDDMNENQETEQLNQARKLTVIAEEVENDRSIIFEPQ